MTVPLDAAESGLGLSGEDGGLSLSGAKARRTGFFRRPVRPPEGKIVLLGACWIEGTGADVWIQRSGAEYWYDSRSLTRGGARSESRP